MKTVMQSIWVAMVVFGLLSAGAVHAMEPVRAGQENSLKRALWNEDRLWLLTDAGQLFTLAADDSAPRLDYADGPVVDICSGAGVVRALVEENDFNEQWTLRHRQEGKWVDDVVLPSPKDGLQALICDANGVTLLTQDRLITVHDGKIGGVSLSQPAGFGSTAVMATDARIFIGFNRGEFGGGLAVIDRATGRVERHGYSPSHDDCQGQAQLACGNMNGFAVVPWHPDCVAMADGLVHFYPSGRIVQYCPDGISRLYFRNYHVPGEADRPDAKPVDPTVETYPTVAFFGLMAVGDDLVAAGIDGIYHIKADGTAHIDTMPEFKLVGPFAVNFDQPGYVLVLTTSNRRFSISGATPLLVAR